MIQSVIPSIDIKKDIDMDKLYYNPGCPIYFHRADEPERVLAVLRKRFGPVKMHNLCCRHKDQQLPEGSVIINNCAGCDRRYHFDHEGIEGISLWEVLDSIELLPLPQYPGRKVSVHDSCSYRRKPQVHEAIRSIIRKMGIEIEESEFSGTNSICCGDNCSGHVPKEKVTEMQKYRAAQFPCEEVVCTCIGCVKSLAIGGKKPLYLIDLVLGEDTDPVYTDNDMYHNMLDEFIAWRNSSEALSDNPPEGYR